MKKFFALLLTLVMVLALVACGQQAPAGDDGDPAGDEIVSDEGDATPAVDPVARADYGIPEQYTKVKIYNGTYGFGDAEIVAAMNDAEDAFYLTFVCFDEEQIVEGTIANGIAMVTFDKTGFMAMDAQQICDDAFASEEPWAPLQ